MMLTILKYLTFLGLLVGSQLTMASLWSPSDNSEKSSITLAGSTINNAELGIFKANNLGAAERPVATFTGNATITFVHNGNNWDISVAGQTATLTDTNQFQLGWFINGNWVTDINVTPSPTIPNLWELTFLDPNTGMVKETIVLANVEPVPQNVLASANMSAEQLSSTAWGFLGGLLGCLAVSKRRTEKPLV